MSLKPPLESTDTFASLQGIETEVASDGAADRQEPRWNDALARFVWRDSTVADIRDFGAVGDGSAHTLASLGYSLAAAQAKFGSFVTSTTQTVDWAATQAALEYVGGRGGGRVLVGDTGANYVLAAADTTNLTNTVAYFHMRYSNVVVEGQGPGSSGITAPATNSAAVLFFQWKGTLFEAYQTASRLAAQTGKNLTGTPSQGAFSVTCATASDAGTFAVGDGVMIRTGQTLGASVSEPDSELNVVDSVNAGTGVVTLRYPLAKGYAQEYFVSGTSGVTSTSVTANLARFEIAKVDTRLLRDVGFRNLNCTNADTTRGIANGEGILGCVREGCNFTTAAYLFSHSAIRRCRDMNNVVVASNTTWTSGFSYAYASADIEAAGNVISAKGSKILFWHVHEGVANCHIHDNKTFSPAGTNVANENVVSIRARNYGTKVANNWFVNGSIHASSPTVYVDATCVQGGEIDGNEFKGSHSITVSHATGAVGWKIGERNRHPASTTVQRFDASLRGEETFNFTAWVDAANAANPTYTLGVIPAFAAVVEVDTFDVTDLFNGTTPTVALGISGTVNAYATATDVSTTGAKTPTLGTSARRYTATERTLIATIAGTSVTSGKLLVSVRIHRAPVKP